MTTLKKKNPIIVTICRYALQTWSLSLGWCWGLKKSQCWTKAQNGTESWTPWKKKKKTWAHNKEKKMVGPTPLRDLRKNPDPRMDGP